MNNIEKLAIAKEIWSENFIEKWGMSEQLIIFAEVIIAKALQSSEPVALPTFNELSKNIDDSRFVGHPKLSALDTNNVKTGARIMYDAIYVWLKKQNTRSTVPLEKYNKLLDALKEILTGWNADVIDAEESMLKIDAEIKAIAEAEGKD